MSAGACAGTRTVVFAPPPAVRHARPAAAAPCSLAGRRAADVRARSSSEVRLVGGLAVETVGELRPGVRTSVVVVPGNPGVAAYYDDFAAALRDELGDAAVCALGLVGHSQSRLHARTYDLDEQIAHVLAFVDAAPAAPLCLVGHSIGAHIALRVLAARPARVASVVGLYPFLQNNTQSPVQRVLALAVRLRPLVWLVALLAEGLSRLPAGVRRALLRPVLRHVGGLGDGAVDVSCDWLRAASVRNTCDLGASEFAALAAPPDWAALRAHTSRVSLFYGPPSDIWAPPQHAKEVQQQAPGVAVATDGTHGHMFCVTPAGARHVAQATAAMLRTMMAPAGTPAEVA